MAPATVVTKMNCVFPVTWNDEPKLLDNPYERTEDIKCAVDY